MVSNEIIVLLIIASIIGYLLNISINITIADVYINDVTKTRKDYFIDLITNNFLTIIPFLFLSGTLYCAALIINIGLFFIFISFKNNSIQNQPYEFWRHQNTSHNVANENWAENGF